MINRSMWFLEISSGSGDCHHWIHFKGTMGQKNKVVFWLCQELCLFIALGTRQHQHSNVSSRALWGGWRIVSRLLDLLGFTYSSRNVLRVRAPVCYLVHLSCYFPRLFKPRCHQFSLVFSLANFYFPPIFLKIWNSISLWLFLSKLTLVFAFSAMFSCCTETPPRQVSLYLQSLTDYRKHSTPSSYCQWVPVWEF